MTGPPDLLARIDRLNALAAELQAELGELRAAVVLTNAEGIDEADGWLEISTAAERFNRPADSLRWLCRHRDCGVKRGGRWLVSAPRLARYLNGGG